MDTVEIFSELGYAELTIDPAEYRMKQTLKELRRIHAASVQIMENSPREDIIEHGKFLAERIASGEWSYVNGMAAILEEYREMYTAKFSAVRFSPVAQERKKSPEKFPAQAPVVPSAQAPEGTFTVIFDNDPDEYETIMIETVTDGPLKGKTIASFLSGSDNETDFTGFAFVDGTRVNIWKRFVNLHGSRKESAVRVITLGTADDVLDAREAYAVKSSRCSRCHHTLTVPASLHRGVGPDCAEILGIA
jgi:hypothetical protein